ncbi:MULTISPECIES: sugar ABC transporter substrate-binding protein [unclassified Fusibacter]|uniref:sugar ABC transporter substrate-binding protein n=1 Tax=unclassified Fusibacter TaxID=2624464 RepID=UPI001011B5DA|nr:MULTISPECIES: substrate-binding domain-containing protein [unclassified Fusibacter]MCK8059662.1 substrate-binding domain-containing protein [Fusibacter sp. A2]NPE21463.1 substrate-binding domain-containing protein [Fusibacter sp. A1]RXV61874.1 sugar ABC transporter substrate-binding protein [Fusibacter sp. A1]
MKKLLVLVLVFVVMLSSVACTQSEGKGSSTLDIGIILPTQNEERWTQDKERFLAAAGETDYNVEILFSEGDSAVEATNIDSFISKGVKVIIITAHDSGAAESAVQRAIDAGVKVIAYDRIVDLPGVSFYVTFDSIVVGNEQGQFLIDNATGKDNELYLFSGGTWEGNAPLFFRGAWETLQPKIADGTFKVMNIPAHTEFIDKAVLTTEEALVMMKQADTDWSPEATATLAANHATTYPPTGTKAYFIAPNDFTSRAINDAFTAAGVTDVIITGQDADILSVARVQDSKQSMTILKDVRTLVANAFEIATLLLDGNDLPAATHFYGESDVPAVPTSVVVVTPENIDKEVVESGYYTQEAIDDAK